jgi:uncharacterized protein
MDYNLLTLFILVLFTTSIFHGITGFGFSLIATPIVLIFTEKEVAVPAMLIISFGLNAFMIRKIGDPIDRKYISPLFFASLLGLPLGVYLLKNAPIDLLKIVVGILAILFTFLIYFARIKLPKKKIVTSLTGFISGILTTSTSMNGPPIVLLLTGQGVSKNKFRKTAVTFFFLMSIVSILLFVYSGVLTPKGIYYGFASLPFVFVAGAVGNKISPHIPEKYFKFLALGAVVLAGVSGIYSGLTGYGFI